MNAEPRQHRPIETALLVCYLAALAYLAAFAFNVGYLRHYGVPALLAEPRLRDLVLAAGFVIVLAIGVASAFGYWHRHLQQPVQPTGRRLALRPVVAIGLAVGVYGVADNLGAYIAGTQRTFLVAAGDTPCVVIRSGTRGLMCVSFDAKTRALRPDYRYLDANSVDLTMEKLGELSGADVAEPEEPSREKPAATGWLRCCPL